MRFAEKYSTILLLCCAMMLAGSCERPPEPTGPRKIGAEVSLSSETRSNVILTKDDITSIGVFGYETDATEPIPNTGGNPVGGWVHPANLLRNQKVTKNGVDWLYNPVAYWPMDLTKNNTFFAYSPHSSEFAPESYGQAITPPAGGPPTLRYTYPTNVADHKDILYSKGVYNVNFGSPEVTNGMVKYEMKHALTWFAFVVNPTDVVEDTGETYSVNRFSFKADNLPLASVLNLETGVWSTPPITRGHVEWDLVLDPATAHNITPDKATRLTDQTNRMMLLPMDLDTGMASLDMTYYYNRAGDSYDTATGEYVGSEYSYSLPIPQTTLQAGTVVVFLINISPEGAYVVFSGESGHTIDEWISFGTVGGGADPGDWIQIF